ncbi:hypothetical protein Misp01_63610 [Microtetraspora sp. NBRC 13810]|uniref:acyl-CoA thioesterase n=1 Tax=Microtetraspora sp. NBRC 13810 TaxID=3030990 RepID=UPI0024A0C68B|nr:thioesterase family protein [Microtetraspora sp. NBRC 13810]GLW11233.1 hypothetical protein Misp01_63610 [Microtetraspora sp. NBRC 13810]
MKNPIHEMVTEAATHTWFRSATVPGEQYATPTPTVPIQEPRPVEPVTGRHIFHRPVRFADIDAHGHVNNVRFVEYLEDARVALFFEFVRRFQDDGGPESPLLGIAIARHEVNYRRPLRFRHGSVRVESWVTKIGMVRCELAAEIRDDHDVFVETRSVVVAIDLATERPRRFTADERAFLRRYLT